MDNEKYQKCGKLKLLLGPMCAGKTSNLLNNLGKYADLGIKVLYINNCLDNRVNEYYCKDISSHSSQFKGVSDKIKTISFNKLEEAETIVQEYDLIGIDEGQFFEDINLYVRKWVLCDNKKIIVSALIGDYKLQNMGNIYELYSIAEVEFLTAFCVPCFKNGKENKAYYTVLNQETSDNFKIGGTDIYTPVCLHHFQQMSNWKKFHLDKESTKIIENMIFELSFYLLFNKRSKMDIVYTKNKLINKISNIWSYLLNRKEVIKDEDLIDSFQIPLMVEDEEKNIVLRIIKKSFDQYRKLLLIFRS